MLKREVCTKCCGVGYIVVLKNNYRICTRCQGWGYLDFVSKVLGQNSTRKRNELNSQQLYEKLFKNTPLPPYYDRTSFIVKGIKRRRQKFKKVQMRGSPVV
jgi:hypothetical protein